MTREQRALAGGLGHAVPPQKQRDQTGAMRTAALLSFEDAARIRRKKDAAAASKFRDGRVYTSYVDAFVAAFAQLLTAPLTAAEENRIQCFLQSKTVKEKTTRASEDALRGIIDILLAKARPEIKAMILPILREGRMA